MDSAMIVGEPVAVSGICIAGGRMASERVVSGSADAKAVYPLGSQGVEKDRLLRQAAELAAANAALVARPRCHWGQQLSIWAAGRGASWTSWPLVSAPKGGLSAWTRTRALWP